MDNQNLSTSNFRIFLKKFIIPFLAMVIPIGYLFNYWFEKSIIMSPYIADAYKVNRIIHEENKDEIPLLGSSRMSQGLIPDSLGKNYFNYGMTGIQDDIVLFFLKEELKKNKKSPIIINYDLDGLNYFMGEYSKFLYNINEPEVIQVLDHYNLNKFYYHIPFIKYFGSYQTFIDDHVRRYLIDRKYSKQTYYKNKGYFGVKPQDAEQELKKDIPMRLNTHQRVFSDPVLLKKFDDLMKTYGNRKIILVVTPCHYSYIKSFTHLDSAYAFLNEFRKYKNVRVFDFSKSPYSDDYFKDTMHLNYKGAQRLSHELKDSLKKYALNF